MLFELGQHEMIDRVARPLRVLHRGYFRMHEALKRPVFQVLGREQPAHDVVGLAFQRGRHRGPMRAPLDPFNQQFDFF